MKCLKVRRKLIAFLDNEIRQRERAKIEGHLNSCSPCREELKILSRVFDTSCVYEEIEPSPHFRKVVRQRIEAQQKTPVSFIEIFRFKIYRPLPKIGVLILLVGLLIIPALVSKSSAATKVLINVDGITASRCEPIKANLRKMTGIKDVDISPNSGLVCIGLKIGKKVNLKEVEKAICDAGPHHCKDFSVVFSRGKKIKKSKGGE